MTHDDDGRERAYEALRQIAQLKDECDAPHKDGRPYFYGSESDMAWANVGTRAHKIATDAISELTG